MFGMVFAVVIILLAVTAVPYVNASPYIDKEKNQKYITNISQIFSNKVRNSPQFQKLYIDFINTVPSDKLALLDEKARTVGKLIDDNIKSLHDLIMKIFEMCSIFTGHNTVTWFIVLFLTIWFVYPIVVIQSAKETTSGGFWQLWHDWYNDNNLSSWFYSLGLLGLLIVPFIYAFWFCAIFVWYIGHCFNGIGDKIRENMQYVYSEW
jgi:hypothetical protein